MADGAPVGARWADVDTPMFYLTSIVRPDLVGPRVIVLDWELIGGLR